MIEAQQPSSTATLKRVLRDRQRAHIGSSCPPCRERKVRCDRRRPCQTCVKRGHADLCTDFEASALPTSASSPRSSAGHMQPAQSLRGVSRPRSSAQHAPPITTNTPLYEGSSLAGLTRPNVSAEQHEETTRRAALGNAAMPLLGVEQSRPGTSGSHRVKGNTHTTLPDDRELTGLFSVYRTRVHPFQPIIEDLPSVERQLCILINLRASLRQVADGQSGPGTSLEQTRLLCLIHAILATGAQFSDLPSIQRASVSRRHAQHAFDLLASCDYIARPSVVTLQALLILGYVMQNNGKPQAAWILGGSTLRMAVALGITPHGGGLGGPLGGRVSPETARSIRLAIVWQDALLSLAFGLSSLAHEMYLEEDLPPISAPGSPDGRHFTYRQAMYWLCHITLRHRAPSWSRAGSPSEVQVKAFLESMSALDRSLLPHLRDQEACCTIQELQEHYSLELHRNSTISTFCRPILSKHMANTFGGTGTRDLMLQSLRISLKRSVKAFIRLRSITTHATRSWAFVHNGLTSALLLSFMRETRTEEESLQIQSDLIQSLARGEAGIVPEAGQSDTNQGQLTEMHEQCLQALKSLRRLAEEEIRQPNPEQGHEQGRDPQQAVDHVVQRALPQPPEDLFLEPGMFDFDEVLGNYDLSSPLPIEAFDRITSTDSMFYEPLGFPSDPQGLQW